MNADTNTAAGHMLAFIFNHYARFTWVTQTQTALSDKCAIQAACGNFSAFFFFFFLTVHGSAFNKPDQ